MILKKLIKFAIEVLFWSGAAEEWYLKERASHKDIKAQSKKKIDKVCELPNCI